MAAIDQDRFRTAVIGCGRVGSRRAEQASVHSTSRLLLAIDAGHEPARAVAERFGSAWSTNWKIAIDDERIDIVVVAAPHPLAFDIATAALECGKHVLLEKPMGCTLAQAQQLAEIAERAGGLLKIGCNHRYHPALREAHELFTSGAIGDVVSAHVRYGHDTPQEGFGVLLDLGIAAVDLLDWFAGAPQRAYGAIRTACPELAPHEDNASALLRYENGTMASFDVSWTEPADRFSLDLTGTKGSLVVEGLGDAYGTERFFHHTRNELRHGDTVKRSFEGPDRSWALEWNDFIAAIEQNAHYEGTPRDGLDAMRVVHALYESARDDVPVIVG